MSAEIMFERIALIGIGLINSSIARFVRQDGLAHEIIIYSRRQTTLDKAMALGLADRAETDPAAAVEGADLVILGAPVGANETLAKAIAPGLKPGAIVTDVGSVKSAVIRDVAPHLPEGVHLVPAHPVAGTEHSGPEAGFAELFQNHWCILTPPEGCDAAATEKVAEFWRRAGSTVDIMDAEHHDKVLAITSHLPQLIAYNIVGTVLDVEHVTKREVVKYAAGGFRDFTRIAASDPEMWRDVFLNNREAVLEMLGRFTEDLAVLQRAIRWGDDKALEELFTRTRAIRRDLIEAKQV
ncbi:MAG: prephenate/arogenate dehydrogenase family protein [Rhodospirillaceae bacterium]|nr:prephenate/arogenate dehydrogenase family protein [Rhodospirillaceae bacterium]MBT4426017.1 prephenate/arogenate dehydrogenase family protein [Rhodospirillaceae bacterium]MBT5037079.1 prephenate/arogenate dehydrogenase family protein [Rhodospirillaceae bacterium]MBT5676774.1 prephenate/arogenate dehydrogenase family protein [Rhodospirillaceae bacterium]MBT5779835.1 prephenate/arogenate dehydrogenase family protein [Rhodospirillaceae bacterium]